MSLLMKLILLLSLVVLSLATAKTHGIQNVKFDILSGQGSVIDTIDSSSTSIDLRGTTTVKVYFDVIGASGKSVVPDQASLIVSKKGSDRNIVTFAAARDGRMVGTFSWALWENQFGSISPGESFDMTVAVGNTSPELVFKAPLTSLLYSPGPKIAPIPGQIPTVTRIKDTLSSLAAMPEIIHQFRPEEKMVAVPVSLGYVAIVLAPTLVSIGYMYKVGANWKALSNASTEVQLLANLFHMGIASIVIIHLAFWLKYNLLQILPVLVPVEMVTMLVGIKLSSVSSASNGSRPAAASSAETSSKKNL